MAETSIKTPAKVVTLWERGLSYGKVAAEVSVSKSFVHFWVKRWQTENENVALKTKPSFHKSYRSITSKLPAPNRANISAHARHTQSASYNKVEFFPRHTENRLNFAHANINRDWDSVIFTDEKVFSTSQDTRMLIWRPNNTRLDPRNVVTIRQSSRITLAYWDWMSSAGPGELTCIGTRMNAAEYIRILEDVLLPSVRVVYPPPHRITLVQDNSAVHTAAAVKEWFQQHQEDIEVLLWPAKSPDLNPIENLWAECGNCVMAQFHEIDITFINMLLAFGNILEDRKLAPI
ncbi:DDE superfamily endonuclease [Popillia japonica]|uniref:DDE superfamily endonuclease n=1 Tax=Popillia japonica TaxID=7064 RepID=A0AAW1HG47_POPJA